jgi:hypothetical protein
MRGNSSAPLVVLPYTSTVLLLPRAMTVVNCRQQLSVHRNFVRTLGRLKPAAVLVLLAATLLPAAAARGLTRTISGYAHVAESFSPPYSRDDADGKPLSSGGAIFGTASLDGGSTASFSFIPTAGAGTASGESAAIDFKDWPRRYSQADGYVKIVDQFTVNGVITDESACRITVVWSAVLRPNTVFESQYAAVYGTKTDTASISFDMTFGWLDSQGNFVGALATREDYGGSDGLAEVELITTTPLAFLESNRTIGLDLTIGGFGKNGGGYALFGIGGLDEQPSSASRSLRAEAASADDSSFEIIVELSPGLSISGHSAYVRQVTIPEPTAGALAPIGLLGLMVLRKRRPC